MSEENVELARKGYEAYSRGDLEEVYRLFDPNIEAHDPPEMPDAAVHRGAEAVKRDWEATRELFDDLRVEVEDWTDAGDDVLVFVRYRGRGRDSGAEVEASMAHVWTMRDGRAVRFRQFFDRDEARRAVES